MNPPAPSPDERPDESLPARRPWARAAGVALLAVLPIAIALGAYYRPLLKTGSWPALAADSAFYGYQLSRAAECQGRWWQIADDPLMGRPYPTEMAKHPGFYEGVDLMLLAALFGRGLAPHQLYHLAILVVLATNGWAASWLIRRHTGSTFWAMIGSALITFNGAINERMYGHLHLLKMGWTLLALSAFLAYLERADRRRGAWLGLTMALALQGSFYLGFLTGLGLAAFGLLAIAAGKVTRAHLAPTLVAGLTFGLAAAPLTFPVWYSGIRPAFLSDSYFNRSWAELWGYGSELWKFFVPFHSALGERYVRDVNPGANKILHEDWYFLGPTILLGLSLAAWATLRPSRDRPRPAILTVGPALIGIWMILSLSGGPSVLIFQLISCFRCYGRAGLLAIAVGAVVSPILLGLWAKRLPRKAALALMTLALALTTLDGWLGTNQFRGWPPGDEAPGWVDWLAEQPEGVRLAAFEPIRRSAFNEWGARATNWRDRHRHETLNGCDLALLDADLHLIGADHDRLTPEAIGFLASLGYDHLAFHREYLAKSPWLEASPDLELVEQRDDWRIVRIRAESPRWATGSLAQVLDHPQSGEARTVPPRAWITPEWSVDRPILLPETDWAYLAWIGADGKAIDRPQPAFYQHLFGPGLPAFCAQAPRKPGDYRLQVVDRDGHVRQTLAFRVDPECRLPELAERMASPIAVESLTIDSGGSDGLLLTIDNATRSYLPAQHTREQLGRSGQTHPGLLPPNQDELTGALGIRVLAGETAPDQFLALPTDLPPGGSVRLEIPGRRLFARKPGEPLAMSPEVTRIGQRQAEPGKAQVRLSAIPEPSTRR
ncbi:MAG: hypothetical protein U0800_07355 [Isosphaeraceae bacterium]